MATGRRPVDQVATAAQITGQDAVWIAVRVLGHQGFRWFDLAALQTHMAAARRPRLKADSRTITGYLDRLTKAGILVQEGALWTLPDDPGPVTPRVRKDGSGVAMGAGRRATWRSIRVMGEFTLDDLVRFGSTEDVQIHRVAAKDYVKALVQAGYVMVIDRPDNRKLPTRYRLLPSKNTGPHPPQIQRTNQVFDPNLNKVVWKGDTECL